MTNRRLPEFVILRASDKDARRTSTSNNATPFRAKLRRRIAPLVAIVLLAVLPLLAQQQADRVKQIGGKFQCMCGCGQILTQCNHVGCTTSTSMLKELGAMVNRGDSEDKITQTFVQEFGTTVYAEPPKSGFSLVAWLMPVFYFLIGSAIVVFFINKWRKQAPAPAAVAPAGVHISPEAYERARSQANRDTED
ncbi:MAG TPA: cytochrome c-type biogenesis protein CcmH [Candidatus Acidoferrales bacterium]|jgi:cytochrome c-type biogenesis protein CcmH|nr:cytochrome c-type biogenesis protein CcmH [Candidatus Acidoferrales bacterium]